jgi:hypothetical protein
MMGFLKFLAIFIIVIYILRFLARIFLPILLKKLVSRMANTQYTHSRYSGFGNQKPGKENKDGIKVDARSKKSSDKKYTGGEYVDFKEIKE